MNREYHKWYSPALNRDMELLLFGHGGRPILVFPTSMGRFFQYEDFGMIKVLAERLEAGTIQLLCVDGVDTESWYNRHISVHARALRHNAYERYLLDEALPWFADRNPGVHDNLTSTGASFGAYHAVNFAFKHPDRVKQVVAMSGAYSLQFLLRGGHDVEEYYNSPLEYMPNLSDEWYLSHIREQNIILVVGSDDICLTSTRQLSEVLWQKNIPHLLDVWAGAWHDWPIWQQMALKFFY
jgi:esterase/lipase superfamily enzyme